MQLLLFTFTMLRASETNNVALGTKKKNHGNQSWWSKERSSKTQ